MGVRCERGEWEVWEYVGGGRGKVEDDAAVRLLWGFDVCAVAAVGGKTGMRKVPGISKSEWI